jgi:hypothetical protein
MTRLLTLNDITDLREYERERGDFKTKMMATKKMRRIHVGKFMTFIFENFDTMRFQIQEMARVEKIVSDDRIQEEIEIYNELIPSRNELKATLLIELTSDDQLREWLPKLPGIQNHIHLVWGELVVTAFEPGEDRLTREEEMTTTVHYLNFPFTDEQRENFLSTNETVTLKIDHPAYQFETALSLDALNQLRGDLAE